MIKHAALLAAWMLASWSSSAATPDFQVTGISVRDHGAAGNGVADDSAAINTAIAACKAAGYKTLFFPNGVYKINSALTALNSSFNVVSVVGENPYQTVIDGSALPAGTPLLKTSGGSGQLTGSEISDVCLKGGSQLQIGVQNKGTCGLTIRNCLFYNLAIGVEFNNSISSGTFTEYSVAERCYFNTDCVTPVKYKRGIGAASFHGSGLRASQINNSSGNDQPAIVIGDAGETCHVYHSPMDFNIWTRGITNVIKVTASASQVSTYGTITLERFGPATASLGAGAGKVIHAGKVLAWGDCSFENLVLVDAAKRNADGTFSVTRSPYNDERTLSAVTNTVSVGATELGSLVTIQLTANNYDYRYRLIATHNGYGSAGYVHSVIGVETNGAPKAIVVSNGAGLDAPTFSLNSSGQLVIVNPGYAGTPVNAKFTINPLGPKKENFWK